MSFFSLQSLKYASSGFFSLSLHVTLIPLHPTCLWNVVHHQMLLATCADLGTWRSANGLPSELPLCFTVHTLSIVCSDDHIAQHLLLLPRVWCSTFSLFWHRDWSSRPLNICWRSAQHCNFNLDKTELFFSWVKFCSKDLSITQTRLLPSLWKKTAQQQTVKWRLNYSYKMNSLHFTFWNSLILFQIVRLLENG